MCMWHAFGTARQYSVCMLSSGLRDYANCLSDNHLDKEKEKNKGHFFHSSFICYLFSVELPGIGFFG